MDFDYSKENIQPLRSGRNVGQLAMALQAQNSPEFQQELQLQREMYEDAIKNYQGNDPLENWYNYISWIEQSYPKHGHEGNLNSLLEHCMKIFENDARYTNDRRFCKLSIKFIDSKEKPLEVYSMMYSKGLCIGCADFYKAWSFFHEAAGDFKNANAVLDLGKKELAQPFEELQYAQENLLKATGHYCLYGSVMDGQFNERRQALVSLHTYKPGRVSSVRVPHDSQAGTFGGASGLSRPNAAVPIFYDQNLEFQGASAAPPISIVAAVKKHEAPKENILAAEKWSSVIIPNKKKTTHTGPGFIVHMDDDSSISCPTYNFPKTTKENFDDWVVSMTMPDPPDPRMVPQYPKSRVYANPTTEYSLEELRAVRHLKQRANKLRPTNVESARAAINSMCGDINYIKDNDEVSIQYVTQPPNGANTSSHFLPRTAFHSPQAHVNSPQLRQDSLMFKASPNSTRRSTSDQGHHTASSEFHAAIWGSPSVLKVDKAERPAGLPFAIYEQTLVQDEIRPKGNAMKTPLMLNDDDLVETGSRGSADIAGADQPIGSANVIFDDDDDSSSSFDKIRSNVVYPEYQEMNDTCNTHMFNFNLNTMHVSTPDGKAVTHSAQNARQAIADLPKKVLFDETKNAEEKLSTILEETKSYRSSSSSSGATTKSSIFGSTKRTNMTAISEEHTSYLEQNLKANDALRRSLLGDFMSYGGEEEEDEDENKKMQVEETQVVEEVVKPKHDLSEQHEIVGAVLPPPSDPFKKSYTEDVLRTLGFPDRSVEQYFFVDNVPKPVIKKDVATHIGHKSFLVEKQLGKGAYGVVYKAVDRSTGQVVALKYQRPSNKWEFYICREIRARLAQHHLREKFMDVTSAFFNDQASVLISQYMQCGSLLDLANEVKQKTSKPMHETLCIYFCMEMMSIVETLHQIRIIHADIKPDNFLIRLTADNNLELQLIDFGCSIDMSLYPPNTSFKHRVSTENFICCQMLDGQPWNYHTDLFCVAATAHVILFGKYIEPMKEGADWFIKHKMPRYIRADIWNGFFSSMLNQLANLRHLHNEFSEALSGKFDQFSSSMRDVVNIVKKR